ncbi:MULTISPECIES: hypothetical protein [Mycolicibacterium]|uniref:hypothetical protein n=1 Tax=Mycolicibacterium TaxID=1866885 RepID=UPI0026040124|nr:hypothetical protein [Mycolicibacterium fortuitum]
MSGTNSATVVTDRAAIGALIGHTLDTLDEQRADHASALEAVRAAKLHVDHNSTEYARLIDEALATGWFTVDGLADQGHRAPRKPRKTESGPTATGIDRDAIPHLIARTLADLDERKRGLATAEDQLSAAQAAADNVAEAYARTVDNALATGWFTVVGLAGQGHTLPKKKPRATRPRANDNAQPATA